MKRSMMKLAYLGIGLSLVAATAGCVGSAEWRVDTTASVSVKGGLDLPHTGNPKYDRFFGDVGELAQRVADARAALERAPATLSAAMNVAGATDFETAIKSVCGKLKGKVTVTIDVGPTGAEVHVVVTSGVTLSAEEQTLVEAYKKVATDVAAIPMKLAPVVPKSIDITRQAVVLGASARSDFTGFRGLMMLPSVIHGLGKATSAIGGIKTDVPVIVEKSKTMMVAIKGAI